MCKDSGPGGIDNIIIDYKVKRPEYRYNPLFPTQNNPL